MNSIPSLANFRSFPLKNSDLPRHLYSVHFGSSHAKKALASSRSNFFLSQNAVAVSVDNGLGIVRQQFKINAFIEEIRVHNATARIRESRVTVQVFGSLFRNIFIMANHVINIAMNGRFVNPFVKGGQAVSGCLSGPPAAVHPRSSS